MTEPLPDPALVVLVGASGSGKSTWAAERYRAQEVVSSDDLRGVVGSGPHDLDASAEAFELLDRIVRARVRRGLATVVDSLGLDAVRRQELLALARAHRLPAVAVLFDTPAGLCRQRNAARGRPVPARVLAAQLQRVAAAADALAREGWDRLVVVPVQDGGEAVPQARPDGTTAPAAAPGAVVEVVLQVSRFPWGTDPLGWLRAVALAAAEAGFSGLALMDHLIQIPQVDRAWAPIPEPWVTLGMLAGLDTRLRLGTLVSPITFRAPGITAKAAATLDVLSGGRAFCGVGAGWWEREHLAFGLGFPPARERIRALESGIETMRALWASGTKPFVGEHVSLPETTCYPRPVSDIPVIVGGAGDATLGVAARKADACNVSSDADLLPHRMATLRRHCEEAGRDPAEVALTVLDLPVVGADRDDAWGRVEHLRGRTSAAAYARRHHAGTAKEHAVRYRHLAGLGVSSVFLALPDLRGPDDVLALAPLLAALA
jgi:alkanesulfonate monooxygenase SsuD/methylene tetrahydromethanopterin reductase-like flavin-dependent oxidoreductase (luciferase family)/predicted kinase